LKQGPRRATKKVALFFALDERRIKLAIATFFEKSLFSIIFAPPKQGNNHF